MREAGQGHRIPGGAGRVGRVKKGGEGGNRERMRNIFVIVSKEIDQRGGNTTEGGVKRK